MSKNRIIVFVICIFTSIMLFSIGFTYRANYFTDDNTKEYSGYIETIRIDGNACEIKLNEFNGKFHAYNLNYSKKKYLIGQLNSGDFISFRVMVMENNDESDIIVSLDNADENILSL